MLRLVLLRHGTSNANLSHLVTGTPRDELSALGMQQAQDAASAYSLDSLPFSRFLVSQWKRAQQTAQILLPSQSFEVDTRLGETDAGEVADWTNEQFHASHPDFYADPGNAYPGGESHLDLYARVTGWLETMQNDCRGNVLVVTHAGPIACLLHEALGIPMDRFPCMMVAQTSLTVIEYPGAGAASRVRMVSHLPGCRLPHFLGFPS